MAFRLNNTALLAITVLTALPVPNARAQEQLRSEEYAAVAIIIRQELSALGKRLIRPVCLRGPVSKVPPKELFLYLSKVGIDVSEPNECYPADESPRGLEINLSNLKRGEGSSLTVTVETGDITPRPGVHVGELLRLGTYELRKTGDHMWKIVSYKNARPGH